MNIVFGLMLGAMCGVGIVVIIFVIVALVTK